MDFFPESREELEKLEEEYNLENCGQSGFMVGCTWWFDKSKDVSVYVNPRILE